MADKISSKVTNEIITMTLRATWQAHLELDVGGVCGKDGLGGLGLAQHLRSGGALLLCSHDLGLN